MVCSSPGVERFLQPMNLATDVLWGSYSWGLSKSVFLINSLTHPLPNWNTYIFGTLINYYNFWQLFWLLLFEKYGPFFSGTLTIFTQERMMAIDYIAMVGSTTVRFVFREPPLALLSNIFTLPFTGAVWLAIFICVLACALFLYITSKWEASVGMVIMIISLLT